MAIIQIDKQSNKRSCSVRAHGAPHGGTTKNKFIERVKKLQIQLVPLKD